MKNTFYVKDKLNILLKQCVRIEKYIYFQTIRVSFDIDSIYYPQCNGTSVMLKLLSHSEDFRSHFKSPSNDVATRVVGGNHQRSTGSPVSHELNG